MVYTLASINIGQSVPNLDKVFMTIRSRISSIMGSIKQEQTELLTLEVGKIDKFDFVYAPASTNINQSVPNLVKMYVTKMSQKSSVMDLIGLEQSELSAL